jgi:hypothetical protein
VNSDVSFEDITGISESTALSIDANGRISVVSTSSLFSQNASSFLAIPNQTDTGGIQLSDAAILAITQGGSYWKQINNNFSFALTGGALIDTLNLKKANVDFTYVNSLCRSGTVTVSIPSATKNGVPFNQTIGFTAASGSTPSNNFHRFNLAGYELHFSHTSAPNSIQLNYTISYLNNGSGSLVSGNGMHYEATFDSIEYTYASGYFGNTPFSIPVDTANISLFNENSTDSFYFSDPSLMLQFENSVGMPVQLSNLNVSPLDKNGQVIELIMNPAFPNPKTINGATSPGQVAYDSIVANSQNSNLAYVLSQKPMNITYGADAQTNLGNPTARNFITDQSKFVAKLKSEIPIEGWAQHYFIQDTFDFQIPNFEEIDSAVFRLTALNGFPMSALTQAYFVDSNFVVVDSLLHTSQDLIIEAADINSNGVSISPTSHTHDESFTSARLELLKDCKKVLVQSTLSTANAPAQNIKVMKNDRLNIKIGVRARLKIKIG